MRHWQNKGIPVVAGEGRRGTNYYFVLYRGGGEREIWDAGYSLGYSPTFPADILPLNRWFDHHNTGSWKWSVTCVYTPVVRGTLTCLFVAIVAHSLLVGNNHFHRTTKRSNTQVHIHNIYILQILHTQHTRKSTKSIIEYHSIRYLPFWNHYILLIVSSSPFILFPICLFMSIVFVFIIIVIWWPSKLASIWCVKCATKTKGKYIHMYV